jgi:hypothetical protein
VLMNLTQLNTTLLSTHYYVYTIRRSGKCYEKGNTGKVRGNYLLSREGP